MKAYVFRILIVSLLTGLQACVGVQTFPGVARSGDTITLALGSLEGANKNNMTFTFISDVDGVAVDLTPGIRSVFNLFPDKTSRVNLLDTNVSQGGGANRTDILTSASAHSAWLTVAVVDLPQGLAIGRGKISVVYDQIIRPANNAASAEDVNILFEIVPGQGSTDNLNYYSDSFLSSPGDLRLLEPKKQVVVRAPVKTTNYLGIKVFAAEYVLNVPIVNTLDSTSPVPDTAVMIIRDVNRYDYVQNTTYDGLSNAIAAQTQMMWDRKGDVITVRFISPTGVLNENFIRFSIVTSIYNDFSVMPTLSSVKYFDQNGDQVAGVQPILERINF